MAALAEFYGAQDHSKIEQDLWPWISAKYQANPTSEVMCSLYQESANLKHFLPTTANKVASYASWSFQELGEASNKLAHHLASYGIRPLDKVACFIHNSVEYGILMWTCFKLHAVFTPLDPGEPARPKQFRDLIAQIQPAAIVAWDDDLALQIEQFESKEVIKIYCNASHAPEARSLDKWTDLNSILQQTAPTFDRNDYLRTFVPSEDDLALLMFTSGTTSSPKGCPLTKRNMQSRWKTPSYAMRTCVSSACFRALHQSSAMLAWLGGGSIVTPSPAYEPESLLRALQTQQCTDVAFVPSQLRDIAQLLEGSTQRIQLVRNAKLAGDIIDGDLLELCEQTLRPNEVRMVYGMTESVGNWTATTPPLVNSSGLLAAGKVAPGSRARIADLGSGETMPINEVGEIHISTACCIDRYLDGRLSELWYEKDGRRWFNTGDLGYFDESGALFITGRSKDVIVKKGLNIFPSIIESCLNSDENVKVSSVVGIPHRHYGAVPVAVLELNQDQLNVQKLIEILHRKVVEEQGSDMKVDKFFTLKDLGFEDWPWNSTGKILKSELVQRVMEVGL